MAVCDPVDGQCACKPHVGGANGGADSDAARKCLHCLDGFFGLADSDAFGCRACGCDVGGTALSRWESAVCDKETGECTCRTGMVGRRCVIQTDFNLVARTSSTVHYNADERITLGLGRWIQL